MTENWFPYTAVPIPGAAGYTTYTVIPPGAQKEAPKDKEPQDARPEQATVFDIPGWNTALNVEGMLEKPGLIGWTSQVGACKTVVVDEDGKLFLWAGESLAPKADGAGCWAVQVSSYQDTKSSPVKLAVYLGSSVPNVLGRMGNYVSYTVARKDFLPVGKILQAPVKQ